MRLNTRYKHVAKTVQCTSLCYSPTPKQKRAHRDYEMYGRSLKEKLKQESNSHPALAEVCILILV